jgi:hypothetical protein
MFVFRKTHVLGVRRAEALMIRVYAVIRLSAPDRTVVEVNR